MLWVHFYMLLNWFRNLYSQYKGQLSAVWALPVLNQLYIKYFYQSRTDRARERTFCSLRFPCPLSSLNTHVRTDKARARQMSNIYTQ